MLELHSILLAWLGIGLGMLLWVLVWQVAQILWARVAVQRAAQKVATRAPHLSGIVKVGTQQRHIHKGNVYRTREEVEQAEGTMLAHEIENFLKGKEGD